MIVIVLVIVETVFGKIEIILKNACCQLQKLRSHKCASVSDKTHMIIKNILNSISYYCIV